MVDVKKCLLYIFTLEKSFKLRINCECSPSMDACVSCIGIGSVYMLIVVAFLGYERQCLFVSATESDV